MLKAHLAIVIFGAAIAFGVWYGIGWGVGWLLDAGVSADVNRRAFEKAGLVIGGAHGGLILLIGIAQNIALRKRV
jgi:hypothetical protein